MTIVLGTALLLLFILPHGFSVERSFSIDYEKNCFLKDGQPFQYFSGGMHYFRTHPKYWQDRLLKIKAAGLNAVQTYIAWNMHEPTPGIYNFKDEANLTEFLNLANQIGLVVVVRLGPYICGEFENGALPWWLLKLPGIKLRQTNQPYFDAVTKWWDTLLPKVIFPMLYRNGGPVVSVQIENEYGSRPMCDHGYMKFLRDLARKNLGNDTVIFTVDGSSTSYLKCGAVDGAYATIDFGPAANDSVKSFFEAQRVYSPKGPLVNTEFYPGWYDVWEEAHHTTSVEPVLNTISYMYAVGASFNFYMFEGGTNFGHWSGHEDKTYDTTTYDYNAPLSEPGDPTEKYYEIRKHLQTITGKPPPIPVPPATPKLGYGKVTMQNLGPLTYLLDILSKPNKTVHTVYPLTFEEINFPYGFILYEARLGGKLAKNLTVSLFSGRCYVLQDGIMQGILQKAINDSVLLNKTKPVDRLQILVENLGRSNYGDLAPQGLLSNVSIDGTNITNWTMYPIEFDELFPTILPIKKAISMPFRSHRHHLQNKMLKKMVKKYDRKFGKPPALRSTQPIDRELRRQQMGFQYDLKRWDSKQPIVRLSDMKTQNDNYVPSVFYGTFPASTIEDTFFNSVGWGKGQLYINGFNVGRYWPKAGPQVTLYIPKWILKPVNAVVLLELERPGMCTNAFSCSISFVNAPNLNGPVSSN